LVEGSLAVPTAAPTLHITHLTDQTLQLSVAEALASEGELEFLCRDHHIQLHLSLGVGQHSAVAEALNAVTLVPLWTLTGIMFELLHGALIGAAILGTGPRNVSAVSLHTGAVLLIIL